MQEPKAKTLFARGCNGKFFEWRDAGLGPKSRAEAIAILETAAGAEGVSVLEVRKTLAREIQLEDGGTKPPDWLALICWDIQENGSRLFRYDRDSNWLVGLRVQANHFLTVYCRTSLQIGANRVEVPEQVHVDGYGYVRLADMSRGQIEETGERFIQLLKAGIRRWMQVVKKPDLVRRKMRQITEEVLAEFEVRESVAAD